MDKRETKDILNAISGYIDCLNRQSKSPWGIIIGMITGVGSVRSYHLYISPGSYHELNDTNENLSKEYPFSVPLDAKITRTNYNNGPINSYLAEIKIDSQNIDVKLYKERESKIIEILSKIISQRYNLNLKIEKSKRYSEHSLEMIAEKGFFEVDLSKLL